MNGSNGARTDLVGQVTQHHTVLQSVRQVVR